MCYPWCYSFSTISLIAVQNALDFVGECPVLENFVLKLQMFLTLVLYIAMPLLVKT
jgi:hypothetical protein